ncbi:MAG: ABC transporter permease [bacterium]
MKQYLLKRLLYIIPMLLGITIITFLVMKLTPGEPTDLMTDLNVKISAEAKERLLKQEGLDKPWYIQYANWLKNIGRFNFGKSLKDGRPVLVKVMERLPATLLLNILSLILIFMIALPIGIISAIKQNSIFDKGLTVFVFIGFSMPTFWFALLLMVLFGIKLGILPMTGLVSINFDELNNLEKVIDITRHLALPVFVSAIGGLAGLSRYMRSGMLEVINQEYIKMARAKGLSESKVILKHALKNALIPVVTILGLTLPTLIGGSFIIETIFAYPGIGRLGFEAMFARDQNLVMGIATIVALLTLLGNLLADIAYAYVDPRIRYK